VKRKALFLDRDGVINVDFGYVHRPDQVEFIDGIFDLCRAARAHGFLIVVVTNQAGIARGLYSEAAFHDFTAWMREQFVAAGAPIDGVYHCPHHPEHGQGAYLQHCGCRKPEPGLFVSALRDLAIDPTASVMIGDKTSDLEAARRAGVARLILLADTRPAGMRAEDACVASLPQARMLLFGASS
jgi:D-glycero-D-manno-heptose 1,7-bisphosphate phosphatase